MAGIEGLDHVVETDVDAATPTSGTQHETVEPQREEQIERSAQRRADAKPARQQDEDVDGHE